MADWYIRDECEAKIDGQWVAATIQGVRVGEDIDDVEFGVVHEDGADWVFPHQLRPLGTVVDVDLPDGRVEVSDG